MRCRDWNLRDQGWDQDQNLWEQDQDQDRDQNLWELLRDWDWHLKFWFWDWDQDQKSYIQCLWEQSKSRSLKYFETKTKTRKKFWDQDKTKTNKTFLDWVRDHRFWSSTSQWTFLTNLFMSNSQITNEFISTHVTPCYTCNMYMLHV